MRKRPAAVTIISYVYLATGVLTAAYHASGIRARNAFQYDIVLVELISLIALLCGAYMLRGSNWARWLALAWMGYHVVLNGFHSWFQFAFHALLLTVFAWLLFRTRSAQYFRSPGAPAV